MSFALEFHAVSKTFRKRLPPRRSVQALRDVSFTVDEGEVFGFVGPNGAGKSTTIKVMLDVIDDYEGEVRLYGVSARDAAARRGVAYLPE
ncbi:ATP-binding cassette domain-containing protein, partial [Arthrospira platensis SPKY1]|nr:ATP-binding cassette domain-containing protein [Arthrospira platensis SPKY1]